MYVDTSWMGAAQENDEKSEFVKNPHQCSFRRQGWLEGTADGTFDPVKNYVLGTR